MEGTNNNDDDVVDVRCVRRRRRPSPHNNKEEEEAPPLLSITERLVDTILRLPRSDANEQLLESFLDTLLRDQQEQQQARQAQQQQHGTPLSPHSEPAGVVTGGNGAPPSSAPGRPHHPSPSTAEGGEREERLSAKDAMIMEQLGIIKILTQLLQEAMVGNPRILATSDRRTNTRTCRSNAVGVVADSAGGDVANGHAESHLRDTSTGADGSDQWLQLSDVDEELSRPFRRLTHEIASTRPPPSLPSIKKIVEAHPRVMAVKDDETKCWTLLHHAAFNSETPKDVLEYLVSKNPQALQERASDGCVPLHHVANRGPSLERVMVLAEACPVALLAKTTTGETPLSLSVSGMDSRFNKPHDVIVYLATKEPRALKEADEGGHLPLHCAVLVGAPLPVVRTLTFMYPEALLARSDSGELDLHVAAKFADSTVVEFLLEQYPEAAQARTSLGELPLHCAAYLNEDFRVIQTLVRRNPEALQATMNGGSIPLHLAAHRSGLDVARFFVEQDPAGLRATTNKGLLPLHVAARNGFKMVRFFVQQYPAGLQSTTNDGSSPLHFAARSGNRANVQLLANAYPQAARTRNKEGFLPLHLAGKPSGLRPDPLEHLRLIYILARMVPDAIRPPAPQP